MNNLVLYMAFLSKIESEIKERPISEKQLSCHYNLVNKNNILIYFINI